VATAGLRPKPWLQAVVLSVALFGGAVLVGLEANNLLAGASTPVASPSSHLPATPSAPPPAPTTTRPAPEVPVSTLLATTNGLIQSFASPGAAPGPMIGTWYGYPDVLPVIAQQADWLQVRLPQRPNESTAWVRAQDVTMTSTPYRIVVRLASERLQVYDAGYKVMDFGVGVGTPATPTVTGSYYVTVRAAPPNAGYGPFVLSTSAHSDAIQSWEGAGDAIIAIHGPITGSADARIGTGNAQISNGCLRLHVRDLSYLDVIPTGTPVDILA
jgi:hypothetical protein